MKEDMNHIDKLLYYGVWGAIFGAMLFYGFSIFRGILSPLVLGLAQFAFRNESINVESMTFLINLFHGFLSSLLISLVVILVIGVLIKARNIKYCAVPVVVVFLLSYWRLFAGSGFTFPLHGYYVPELINPMLLVVVFVGAFWVRLKLGRA